MINRYLGNKTDLLSPIMEVIHQSCPPGSTVCDIFSGTLAVSFELKKQGYNVIANDINLFSAVIGKAFLENSEIPPLDLSSLVPQRQKSVLLDRASTWASKLAARDGYRFLIEPQLRPRYVDLLALILFLNDLQLKDVPQDWQRTDFSDTYTEGGRNSYFLSQRGSSGRRRFFSDENGRRMDAILSQIRCWRQNGSISKVVYYILLALMIRAVEKVSNTQGTYHDFPREAFDPRALNPLVIDAPPMDIALAGGKHIVGIEEDSLEFIRTAPEHDLIYIDPPYNFRQYTSYYFMPNLICRYPDIVDLDDYFGNIKYVRGQNMNDDFTSSFCKPSMFIDSLKDLISDAKTKIVLLSYFDGKNHWNDFKATANGVGRGKLKEFFTSTLFEPGSLEIIPIPRTNYQSYGGYKARKVEEYLFVARKNTSYSNGME